MVDDPYKWSPSAGYWLLAIGDWPPIRFQVSGVRWQQTDVGVQKTAYLLSSVICIFLTPETYLKPAARSEKQESHL
jgi:hypothetical protein